MPAPRINMRKIKDVLRLKLQARLSHERIAAALGISKGVVTKYCTLAAACGLDWPVVAALSETALERRLLAGRADRRSHYIAPDYGQVHHEMRRKGMTLMLLWEEYIEAHPEQPTWRYSQFCENYHRYCLLLRRSMRQVHRAGEKLFVDYAGPTIALEGGGVANIFVAALGASSFTFVCATPRQTLADWLHGCGQALQFIGGVPQLIVPDNPRALIADPNRYEPRANETVEDFARHYGTSVLPARPYRPQDKAKVESAVQVVERWILMRLRRLRLHTIDDVNQAIEPLLKQLNDKPFQKLPGSRASSFAALDAPALQPLPAQPWEWANFKTVRVHIDHHVEIDGHRYSAPQNLVGLQLEARITAHAVELLHRGQRVAAHPRSAHRGGFTTTPEHLSAAHRAHLEWTPQRLIHWGNDIGPMTGHIVRRLLEERRHPEHGYRACLGLLSLAKKYGKPRLEAACVIAAELGTTKYSHVRDILANDRDRQNTAQAAPEWNSPQHAHVRGATYYQ
ncbi:MAG: IS21 family transposase [Thiomonas sp.]